MLPWVSEDEKAMLNLVRMRALVASVEMTEGRAWKP